MWKHDTIDASSLSEINICDCKRRRQQLLTSAGGNASAGQVCARLRLGSRTVAAPSGFGRCEWRPKGLKPAHTTWTAGPGTCRKRYATLLDISKPNSTAFLHGSFQRALQGSKSIFHLTSGLLVLTPPDVRQHIGTDSKTSAPVAWARLKGARAQKND